MPKGLHIIRIIDENKVGPLFFHAAGELKTFAGMRLEPPACDVPEGCLASRAIRARIRINPQFPAGRAIAREIACDEEVLAHFIDVIDLKGS